MAIDVSGYGADPSADPGTNRAAFQAAIDDAIATSDWVSVGDGVYGIEPAPGEGNGLVVAGTVRIVGRGRRTTILRLEPEDPDSNLVLLNLRNRCDVVLEDLSLAGSAGASADVITTGVILSNGHAPVAGSVTLNRSDVNGFDVCLKVDGPVDGRITDGVLSAGRLVLRDATLRSSGRSSCLFHNGGILEASHARFAHQVVDGLDSQAHGIYMARHVAFLVEDCEFEPVNGYAVHPYGGKRQPPAFAILRRCSFANQVLTNPDRETLIEGCLLAPTAGPALAFHGPTTVRRCRLRGDARVHGEADQPDILIEDSRLVRLTIEVSNASVVARRCVIRVPVGGVYGVVVRRPATTKFLRCRFGGFPEISHLWADSLATGMLTIFGCTFRNSATTLGIRLDGPSLLLGRDNKWADGARNLVEGGESARGALELPRTEPPFPLPDVAVKDEVIQVDANDGTARVSGPGTIRQIHIGGSAAHTRFWATRLVLNRQGAAFDLAPSSHEGSGHLRSVRHAADTAIRRVLLHLPDAGWVEITPG